MGNRLSKIYTRTGDDGTTGLGDGMRVSKCADRVHAMGDVDELNCVIGLLVEEVDDELRCRLMDIQHGLFDLGGELSIPGYALVRKTHIQQLEKFIDEYNEALSPLKDFILPGGNKAASLCHLARSVCRRAERTVSRLAIKEEINAYAPVYLNRLSDLLFVIARVLARKDGGREIIWEKDRLNKQQVFDE